MPTYGWRKHSNVFLIQIDASSVAEFEISEFEIARVDCTYFLLEKYHLQMSPCLIQGSTLHILKIYHSRKKYDLLMTGLSISCMILQTNYMVKFRYHNAWKQLITKLINVMNGLK